MIEQGYEDYRHKLTRSDFPPYDIQLLFSQPILAAPLDLIQTVGKASLEQFVLLNQLNQSLADLLLSGRIAITDLGSFCSNPLEIVISGTELLRWFSHFNDLSQEFEIPLIQTQFPIKDLDLTSQDALFQLIYKNLRVPSLVSSILITIPTLSSIFGEIFSHRFEYYSF